VASLLSESRKYTHYRPRQELLHKLEKVEAKLQQTELDLQNEQDARRRFQQDVLEIKERESSLVKAESYEFVGEAADRTKGRRPFAVVLVDADADGYVVSIPDSCTAHPRSQH
jgi:hypothetical protein